ncbi:hypothetical protein I553_2907 [Mycobacterium xenopi 4042]|uniref:Uncharacterized protein n=1 Tax=Mycobacterium xenopi 4042 TaxID=1299334 RepID=X8ECH2_MYCXE|nr:hypothetical protein I553_2907 [Mycobacterium xenopi 4042]
MLAVVRRELMVDQFVYLTGRSDGRLNLRTAATHNAMITATAKNAARSPTTIARLGRRPPERHRPEPGEFAAQRACEPVTADRARPTSDESRPTSAESDDAERTIDRWVETRW